MFYKNRAAVHLLISAALLLSLNADTEDDCSTQVRVLRNTKYDVFQGEQLWIQCPVGFCSLPPPTVVWSKVDETLIQINSSSSRGTKIVWEQTKKLEGTSFLIFERIHRNNSGLYRCMLEGSVSHNIRVQVHETPELSTIQTGNGRLTEHACSDVCCQYFYRTLGVLAFFLILTAVWFTSKRCYKGRPRTRAEPPLQTF